MDTGDGKRIVADCPNKPVVSASGHACDRWFDGCKSGNGSVSVAFDTTLARVSPGHGGPPGGGDAEFRNLLGKVAGKVSDNFDRADDTPVILGSSASASREHSGRPRFHRAVGSKRRPLRGIHHGGCGAYRPIQLQMESVPAIASGSQKEIEMKATPAHPVTDFAP